MTYIDCGSNDMQLLAQQPDLPSCKEHNLCEYRQIKVWLGWEKEAPYKSQVNYSKTFPNIADSLSSNVFFFLYIFS